MFDCRTNKPLCTFEVPDEVRMRPKIPLERFEVFAEGLDHPEGLAFDADQNLWAGGEAGQLYCIDPKGRVRIAAELGGFNLGLTFTPKQDLYVCNSKHGALILVDRKGRALRSWERAGSYRLRVPNASVLDRQGNLYFSDSGQWMQNDGLVFVLRPNGRIERLLESLAFPNGLALSADERTLYVVQSTKDDVLAVKINPDGKVGRPRVFAKGLARVPDGAAFDVKGNLYVTCYASDNVYVITPGGKVSLLAEDPYGTTIARPTNAAFGGENSDEMYLANLGRWHICRTRVGIAGQPLAGQR